MPSVLCRRAAGSIGRCQSINTEWMVNDEIRDREVRVIDENGGQLGVMQTRQALAMAEEKELDLVKIAPQATPPVCKFMDYGKFRFEQSKREKDQRKNQRIIEVKEIRLSPTIEDHDIDVRVRNAIKFLKDGDKLKCSIRFRGRMVTHSDIGVKVMNDFYEKIKDYAVIDRRPLTEGRMMTMMLSPRADKPEGKKADEKKAPQKEEKDHQQGKAAVF